MPGYIIKQLQKYRQASPPKQHYCPYKPQPRQYGSEAQRPLPRNTSPHLSKDDIKHIQRVIRNILYYALAVDLTVLMALSTIASKQSNNTKNTDHCPQKEDPNRIRITAGGNLINYYPGELTTRTANVMTAKLLWQELLPIGPL